jgi:DNA (cytosine-5)-methyltransferase 1
LSSNKGFDFAAVLNEMAETGYSLWWQVLNAKDFGVPQNRERIFVIGFRDRPAPEVFFERFDDQSHFEQDAPQSRRILKSPIRSQGDKPMIHQLNQPTHSNDRVYGEDGLSPCLNTMQGSRRQPFVAVPEATKQGYAIAEEGDSINLSQPNSTTRRGRVGHRVANTIDCAMQQHTLTDSKIRRLTPTECERLMGLPDGWTSKGILNDELVSISDSQRYKLCGNGVVVNVVETLLKEIILNDYYKNKK